MADRTPRTPRQRAERIEQEISGVKSQYGITSANEAFLANVKTWRGELTPNMEKYLVDLERKVFPEDASDDE